MYTKEIRVKINKKSLLDEIDNGFNRGAPYKMFVLTNKIVYFILLCFFPSRPLWHSVSTHHKTFNDKLPSLLFHSEISLTK
jgi:hypothetical protein